MSQMIIAHAPADAALAREVCGALAEFQPLALPVRAGGAPVNFGPNVLISMLWTPQAAALTDRFAQLTAAGGGRALVMCDQAEAPEALRVARPVITDVRQAPEELARLVRALQKSAVRSDAPPPSARGDSAPMQKPAPKASAAPLAPAAETMPAHMIEQGKALSGGMARGFASSVAMLGLGGVVTLGVGERIDNGALFGTDQAHASGAFANAAVEVMGSTADPVQGFEPGHNVLSYEEMIAGADHLRSQAAQDRAEVAQILSQTAQSIEATRKETDRTLERLESLSQGGGVFGAQFRADADTVTPQRAQVAATQAQPHEQKPVQQASAEAHKPSRIDPANI